MFELFNDTAVLNILAQHANDDEKKFFQLFEIKDYVSIKNKIMHDSTLATKHFKFKWNLCHIIALLGGTPLLELILALPKEVIIEKDEIFQNTALHYAVLKNKNNSIIQFLISHYPELIDTPNIFGMTPLHYAAMMPENLLTFLIDISEKTDDLGAIPNDYTLLQTPLPWDSFLFKENGKVTQKPSTYIQKKTGVTLYRHMTSTSHYLDSLINLNTNVKPKKRNPFTSAYRNQVYNHTYPDLYIANTNTKKGYGLFTHKSFKEGEFIGIYNGEILTLFESMLEEFHSQNQNNYIMNLDDKVHISTTNDALNHKFSLVVNAKYKGGYCRFINHHSHPNCEIFLCTDMGVPVPIILVKRGCTIKKDDELSFYYGDYYSTILEKI